MQTMLLDYLNEQSSSSSIIFTSDLHLHIRETIWKIPGRAVREFFHVIYHTVRLILLSFDYFYTRMVASFDLGEQRLAIRQAIQANSTSLCTNSSV